MPELRDDDLILYYYGEAPGGDAIRRRLETSPADRKRYDELCRLFEQVDAHPVPEPHDDYGARVWRQVQTRLREQPRPRLRQWLAAALTPRRLALASSLAVLLATAFAAGRFWPTTSADVSRPLPTFGRERILMVSVGEHLEQSEMLLIELVNAPADGLLDLVEEPRRAEELLSANRLYRQAAQRSDQPGIAEVLDELERLLLDVAHGGDLSADDLDDLRHRIDSGGILFRVQVVGSRIQRHNPPIQPPGFSGEV